MHHQTPLHTAGGFIFDIYTPLFTLRSLRPCWLGLVGAGVWHVGEFWQKWKWEWKLPLFTYLSCVWNGNQSSDCNWYSLLFFVCKWYIGNLHCFSLALKLMAWNNVMTMKLIMSDFTYSRQWAECHRGFWKLNCSGMETGCMWPIPGRMEMEAKKEDITHTKLMLPGIE